MERGEEGRLGPLMIASTPADHCRPQPLLLDKPALKRRRRPFGGVELLDAVHEIEAKGARRPDVDRSEYAGVASRGHDLGIGKSRIARQLGKKGRALGHVAVFRGDRGERDPFAQALDRCFLTRLGRLAYFVEAAGLRQHGQRLQHYRTRPRHG